ncbi:MAG: hypothetical protein AAFO80_16830 [Pseudomonadota bacterium]
MDLKSRKLIWFLVGALGIGLILEGAGSAMALAKFGPGAHVLTKDDESVAIAATVASPQSDHAVRLTGTSVSFGLVETYRLPDGATVRCRYIGPLALCSNGWSAVAS